MKEKNLPEEAWEIAKARIEAMPQNLKMSIGRYGILNKDQIIEHLEKHDDVGRTIAEAQLEFLRIFKQKLQQVK